MPDFLQTLRDRGFIEKTTDDEGSEKPLARLLAAKRVTGYVGFDPTAPSLHVGNLVPIMGLKQLQLAGHRPIVIFGGGTGMVGDPSGKTELRKVLGPEEVRANLEAQREQISRYLDLAPASDPAGGVGVDGGRGLFLDNGEWLLQLNYVEFLREVGRHFSVNRMLAAESVRLRLESEGGLSFLEFNYSLLQAYDFLVLNQRFGCELQLGGGDQWGNIVAGIDLIRRATGGKQAHGITFPLMTTAGGKKMGKTEKGAVWLDAARTSPYDFFQYWINTDDRDVGRFLRIFTLLPLAEIERLEQLQGAELREAKRVLAREATALAHGAEEARKAEAAARALFGAGDAAGESVPSWELPRVDLERGVRALEIAARSGLCESRNAARRLAQQNGLYVNGEPAGEERLVTAADLKDGAVLLRAGKKKHLRVVPK